ncbi:RNA polymerase sigma factor [Rasiella sp. SM2506]|uniref:RNA polymerase sigma factor n=1 Tax=Rasiella sp. SM2506 TaxID=3423914 RepID=UPI003D7A4F61
MQKDLHSNVCEKSVFSKLYTQYATSLHNFLFYKYGLGAQANDMMQEAFISLWEACKNVTPSKAKSFLFTVATNKVLNELKHQKVVLKYQKIQPRHYTNETPEFILQQEEFLQQYQTALSNLSEDQRIAFSLSKIEGKKHKEIAELLGVTQKVVEYRIYSAFDSLKGELKNFKI